MTSDNKFKPTFKKEPNVPKTETRIILEQQDLYPDYQSKHSKLSLAARSKVANKNQFYQSQDQEAYGPCSYSGCPWPASVSCKVDIDIEGNNRKWARKAGNGAWLPGYWEPGNFNSSQLSRWNLTLEDVDQSRRVLPLLSNDSVYTLNFWGRHCAEDGEFCNAAMDVIRESIRWHELGNDTQVRKTLPSDISKWSRWGFKLGAGIAATATLGPGGAMAVGAGTWYAGNVVRECCESDRAKSFWGTVGDMGGEAFKGGLISNAFGTASSSWASQTTKLVGHEAAREIAANGGAITSAAKTLIFTGRTISIGQKVYKIYDACDTWGSPIIDAAKHQEHVLRGVSYQSGCKVCN